VRTACAKRCRPRSSPVLRVRSAAISAADGAIRNRQAGGPADRDGAGGQPSEPASQSGNAPRRCAVLRSSLDGWRDGSRIAEPTVYYRDGGPAGAPRRENGTAFVAFLLQARTALQARPATRPLRCGRSATPHAMFHNSESRQLRRAEAGTGRANRARYVSAVAPSRDSRALR
jgi:hypothetical protein